MTQRLLLPHLLQIRVVNRVTAKFHSIRIHLADLFPTQELAPGRAGVRSWDEKGPSHSAFTQRGKRHRIIFAPAVIKYDNLWDYLGKNFSLPAAGGDGRVQGELNWYASHGDYLQRTANRASPYLYYIVQQVKARNMPLDIALLPVVESAFDPFAYSNGRAAGLWQFIPGTGKRWDLKQNWWYDGRRDIVASTNAALDYLQYLHAQFNNDWLLALAASHSGSG